MPKRDRDKPPNAVGIYKLQLHDHDILSGRGGASNKHPGNRIYRTVVEILKPKYAAALRHDKVSYAVALVNAIESQSPPGRFLEKDKRDGLWYELHGRQHIDKTAQALREKVHKSTMLPHNEIPEAFQHLLSPDFEPDPLDIPPPRARKKRKGDVNAAPATPTPNLGTFKSMAIMEGALAPTRSLYDWLSSPFAKSSTWGTNLQGAETFDVSASAAEGKPAPGPTTSVPPPITGSTRSESPARGRVRTARTAAARAVVEKQDTTANNAGVGMSKSFMSGVSAILPPYLDKNPSNVLPSNVSAFLPSYLEPVGTLKTFGASITSFAKQVSFKFNGTFGSKSNYGKGEESTARAPSDGKGLFDDDDDDDDDDLLRRLRTVQN